jgi:hypothetical protein
MTRVSGSAGAWGSIRIDWMWFLMSRFPAGESLIGFVARSCARACSGIGEPRMCPRVVLHCRS